MIHNTQDLMLAKWFLHNDPGRRNRDIQDRDFLDSPDNCFSQWSSDIPAMEYTVQTRNSDFFPLPPTRWTRKQWMFSFQKAMVRVLRHPKEPHHGRQ